MIFYNIKKSKNPYQLNSTSVMGEPDLRQELRDILYNENRGSYVVLRRVRRNSQGNPILASSTLTNRSGEATYGTNSGMKYLFDDYIVTGYISEGSTFHETGSVKEYGDLRTDKLIVFLEYNVLFKHTGNLKDMPDEYDKIIVPEIDINGKLVSPLKYHVKHDIGSVEPFRLDSHGRVEYFKINLLSNPDNTIVL